MTTNQDDLNSHFSRVLKDDENKKMFSIEVNRNGVRKIKFRISTEIEDWIKTSMPEKRAINLAQRGYRWRIPGKDSVEFYYDPRGILGDISDQSIFATTNLGFLRIVGASAPDGVTIELLPEDRMTSEGAQVWVNEILRKFAAWHKLNIAAYRIVASISVSEMI